MPNIKTITLPSGTTYNIVDQGARDLIAELLNYTRYLGVTTTVLTEGSTANPITIGGESVTAASGDVATYNTDEYIFNGSIWQQFGSLSGLGTLAYKNSASGNFQPAGSVTVGTTSSKKTVGTTSGESTYTPAGSVSLSTSSTSISLDRSTGTSSSYSVKEVSGVSVGTTSSTPTITLASGTSSDGYQVSGSVSAPTITVVPTTTTVNSITDVGTSPSLTTTVSGENLTIGWSAGTLPTKGSDTTVATGISSASSSTPTFTGGYVKASSSSVTTPTGSATPTYDYVVLSDSVDIPTSASFSGTGVRLETAAISEPSGTNTFTGTTGTVTVS